MIVIATNNGANVLPALIASLHETGHTPSEFLIVDTGTTEATAREYLALLATQGYCVTRTPYKGYDTGAWLWAYREFPADEYLFLHDSILVDTPEIVNVFRRQWQHGVGAVAFAGFPMFFDNNAQMEFLADCFDMDRVKAAERGIFGNLFYTRHAVLQEMEAQGFLPSIPNDKNECCALERGWATAFRSCGFGVVELLDNYRDVETSGVGVRKVYQHRL